MTSETAPVASIVRYEFPARGDMPAVKLTWYDGGLKPPRPGELAEDRELPSQGLLCVGDDGKLLAGFGSPPTLLPESRFRNLKPPEPTLPRIQWQGRGTDPLSLCGHHREWLDACKGGAAPLSNFGYAGPLTETVLLGVIAIRTGKKLHWDAENRKLTNVPAANAYVRPPYREGWAL